MIGIAGGSACGKTTFARHLRKSAGEGHVTILELDRFYLPSSQRTSSHAANFDRPEALDLDLVESVVSELQQRGESNVPVYDFASHDRVGFEHIDASPVIIVEGILALWHAPLRRVLDSSFFVDTPHDDRLARRIERDGRERGRTPMSVRQQWFETVLPMHLQFVEPTKAYADHIVDGRDDLCRVAAIAVEQWKPWGSRQP